jgi:ribosomal protein S18 acetylase RimI-like enzyme
MATPIRPYRNDDWEAIRTIYDLAKPDEMRGSIQNLSAILPLADDTRRRLLFRESSITVAEDADQVIGFAGHQENYISWMYVHPEHRRQGIAIALLLEMLPRLGRPVTLNVGKNNDPARRLYEQLGFIVEQDFTGHWDNGEAVAVLTLRLDGAS